MSKAIMKQALDALDCHTLLTRPIHNSELAMQALRQAIAQDEPEPEPVAWIYDFYADQDEVVKGWVTSDYDEAHCSTMGCHNIQPLYTAPVPAYVPLSDDDLDQIIGKFRGATLQKMAESYKIFARMIERAVRGEK